MPTVLVTWFIMITTVYISELEGLGPIPDQEASLSLLLVHDKGQDSPDQGPSCDREITEILCKRLQANYYFLSEAHGG
jgi:hypothetical protein